VKSIILVGGKGTRLRPLTFEMPKQMLPLVGQPMLECVFASLAKHNVDEVVLSLGYLPDQFIEAYPLGSIQGVKLTYAVEPEPLDTAGAIRYAALAGGIDDTFLVVNGDVLTDLDLSELVTFHERRHALGTIALHEVDDPSRYGVVTADDEGRVAAFVEKPPRESAPSNLINAGTYVFEPEVIDFIAPDRKVSVEREIFPFLSDRGSLFAMPDNAYWIDTGTPESFLQANVDVLHGFDVGRHLEHLAGTTWRHPSATVAPGVRSRNAVIDRDCVIGTGVVLENVVLMPGAIVRDGAHVRNSLIGPRAVIGSSSVLGPTCVVGADYVVPEHSRLAGEVKLGDI
jgi:mannose-1-phosphate guanylyltransferase